LLEDFFEVPFRVFFFAARAFAARAARALTRFFASLARASGDSGFLLRAFFVGFFDNVADDPADGGRPEAGRTSVTLPPT